MDKEISDLLGSYSVPPRGIDLLKKAKIIFVVGVSGVGKNTIIKELLKTGKYKLVISHTTRKPRENHGVLEKDRIDYHFIDLGEARQMLLAGDFIEAKHYSGNIYGTSLREVQAAYNEGKIAISDIEVQGVAEYMKVSPNVTPIFILPPNFDTWQQRLQIRYEGKAPDPVDIQKRMETAKKELQEALSKDYFEFVINDDLSRAVAAVDEIAQGNLSTAKNQQARELARDILKKL